MNKKAQIGIGTLLIAAIVVIIGLVLFQQAANNVETVTRSATGTLTETNGSYTPGNTVNIIELKGQELVSVTQVANATGIVIPAGNYSIAECVRASDGLKGICYRALNGDGPLNASRPVLITYVYYPEGYADSAGARSVAGIIILLAAVAIALVVLPSIKDIFD